MIDNNLNNIIQQHKQQLKQQHKQYNTTTILISPYGLERLLPLRRTQRDRSNEVR